MKRVALFGIGSEAVAILKEFYSLYWCTVQVDSVFFNDSQYWGMNFTPDICIERPSEIISHHFDKLIICAVSEYKEAVISLLTEKLGVEEEKIVTYYEWLEVNVGMHNIDWEDIHSSRDILSKLQQCTALNDLEDFYYNQSHREMTKYLHYFEVYDRHFKKYRNTDCVVVEIGICKGGSLQMWKNYFGEKAKIIGIDIDESTLAFEEDQVKVEIGSQSDQKFWKKFKEKYPRVDILIDDGGHTMEQQIVTFEEMFSYISENGIYLCEDMHTSYWYNFGGGYKEPTSYIEYTKNFVDYINAWYNPNINEDNIFTHTMHSLHYYDSMLVIEKRKMKRSICITTGNGD